MKLLLLDSGVGSFILASCIENNFVFMSDPLHFQVFLANHKCELLYQKQFEFPAHSVLSEALAHHVEVVQMFQSPQVMSLSSVGNHELEKQFLTINDVLFSEAE